MTHRSGFYVVILGIAVFLRLWGLPFATYHPDEKTPVNVARKMIQSGTLKPDKMSYGTLTSYLQAATILAVNEVASWVGVRPVTDIGKQLVFLRLISVLASVGTVALTIDLARRLFQSGSPERGPPGWEYGDLLAGGMLTVSFLSVQCAHYTTVDSPMALLSTGSVYLAFRAFEAGRWRYFCAAGLVGGLAMATKYTGVLCVSALVLVPLVSRCPRPWGRTFVGLLWVPIGFVIGMPYALLDREKFLKALAYESEHYSRGIDTVFAIGEDTWKWNLEFLYYTALGPALMLGAVLGGMLLLFPVSSRPELRIRPGRSLLVVILPVLACFFLARYKTRFDRNLLPVLPGLCIAAAWYFQVCRAVLTDYPRILRWVWTPALVLALVYPGLRAIVFDAQLSKPHTKLQLSNWIQTLPPDTKVARHGRHQAHTPQWFHRKGYDLVIMSSHSLEPVAAYPDRYPLLASVYPQIFRAFEVEKVFRNPWFDSDFFAPHHLLNSATVNLYHGPTLWVLRVPVRLPPEFEGEENGLGLPVFRSADPEPPQDAEEGDEG